MVGGGRDRSEDSQRVILTTASGRSEQIAQLTDGGLKKYRG